MCFGGIDYLRNTQQYKRNGKKTRLNILYWTYDTEGVVVLTKEWRGGKAGFTIMPTTLGRNQAFLLPHAPAYLSGEFPTNRSPSIWARGWTNATREVLWCIPHLPAGMDRRVVMSPLGIVTMTITDEVLVIACLSRICPHRWWKRRGKIYAFDYNPMRDVSTVWTVFGSMSGVFAFRLPNEIAFTMAISAQACTFWAWSAHREVKPCWPEANGDYYSGLKQDGAKSDLKIGWKLGWLGRTYSDHHAVLRWIWILTHIIRMVLGLHSHLQKKCFKQEKIIP